MMMFNLELIYMDFISNIKFTPPHSRVTPQELEVKHLLKAEGIPFVFQKELNFINRTYFVDFLIADKILLECSYTSAYQYDVVLRQKAILLEAKTSFINQFHNYSMWVLFEAKRFIGEKLHATLIQLMPSVDQIFISVLTFRENLLEAIYNGTKNEFLKFHLPIVNPQYSAEIRLSPANSDSNDEDNNFSLCNRFNHSSLYPDVFNGSINYEYPNYPYLEVENNYSYDLNLNFTKSINQMQMNLLLFDGE